MTSRPPRGRPPASARPDEGARVVARGRVTFGFFGAALAGGGLLILFGGEPAPIAVMACGVVMLVVGLVFTWAATAYRVWMSEAAIWVRGPRGWAQPIDLDTHFHATYEAGGESPVDVAMLELSDGHGNRVALPPMLVRLKRLDRALLERFGDEPVKPFDNGMRRRLGIARR